MTTSARRLQNPKGFTLLELVVVILIVGILAAFAVPQYMKSLESNKAEDAAALVNMVATTNRMFAIDHGGQYTSGTITSACNAVTQCPNGGVMTDPCNLISCKYLAPTDWNNKPYIMAAGDGTTCTAGAGSGGVACAGRRTGAAPGTNQTPYTGWGYSVSAAGVISVVGGAPTPSQ